MGQKSNNSGCGCLVLFAILLSCSFIVNKCKGDEDTEVLYRDNKSAYNRKNQQTSAYTNISASERSRLLEEELSEEDKQYYDHSLSSGTMPYRTVYGNNYTCPNEQCSGIRVTAPVNSDIVVIIKKNNIRGNVVSHGYISAGDTYQFDLPDGIYQVFFYYGRGWNPNKKMKSGLTGGFVADEYFSKDDPQEIISGVLSYVLQLRTDGNFQTKDSSLDEVF